MINYLNQVARTRVPKKSRTQNYILALFLPLYMVLTNVQAQYLLTAISPPPQFTHDDLWNLSITRTNTQDNYTQFYLGLRIYNTTGQLEVKTNSSNFSLNQNVTVINIGNINTVQPFTINYYNGTLLQQVIASGGLFPAGTFLIQFTLFGRPTDGVFTELADFNYEVIVDALWPPILLLPEDRDTITVPNPILTWTPAFSTAFTGNITYSLTLVKIMPGQTKEQAIVSNPTYYKQNSLYSTFDVYNGLGLETGFAYAWRVHAQVGGQLLPSQVWEFTLAGTPSLNPVLTTNIFSKLAVEPDGFVYLAKNMKLNVLYDEEYDLPSGYTNLNFKIYDHTGIAVASSTSGGGQYPIQKGSNYLSLSCTQLGLQQSNTYLLEISNLKNEKFYLRFKPQNLLNE